LRRLTSVVLALMLGLAVASPGRASGHARGEPHPPFGESTGSPQSLSEQPADLRALTLVIKDAVTHEETPVRCTAVNADGDPAYPFPAPAYFYHAPINGVPGYFYTEGRSTLFVPEGPTRVTISKGFEFETLVDTIEVRTDTTLVYDLNRWIDLSAVGLYSGDCHTHANHSGGVYTVTPQDAHFIADAEGLNVINCLDCGYCFTGGPDSCSTSDCIVYMGEEYKSDRYGHADLLGLNSLVLPASSSWWPLLMDVADTVHAQPNAAIICAHPVTTEDFFDIESISGKMLARELPVDVARHKVDGYELLSGSSISRQHGVQMWYRILNCGFRLPACAGTDACLNRSYGNPPGCYRAYAQVDGEFTYDSWLGNLLCGRAFVTNGPLITHFDVRNFAVGDSVDLETQGVTYVSGRVRVECQSPLTKVDIVRNGVAEQTFYAEEGERVIDVAFLLPVRESSWIAARASGPKATCATIGDSLYAHSGPIYLCLNGDRVLDQGSAQELVGWVSDLERLCVAEGEWSGAGQSARLFAELVAARTFYSSLAGGATTGAQAGAPMADAVWISPASPNPFTETLALTLSVPREGRTSVRIYSSSGRLVRTLVDRDLSSGRHSVSWDGRTSRGASCASGVYFCRVDAQGQTACRKIVLMR
jgi:TolB protein